MIEKPTISCWKIRIFREQKKNAPHSTKTGNEKKEKDDKQQQQAHNSMVGKRWIYTIVQNVKFTLPCYSSKIPIVLAWLTLYLSEMVDLDKIKKIGVVLNDKQRPLKERFRALFTLRNIGGKAAISCIESCFTVSSSSYVLFESSPDYICMAKLNLHYQISSGRLSPAETRVGLLPRSDARCGSGSHINKRTTWP